jgi:pantoate--beta-alanine ligase
MRVIETIEEMRTFVSAARTAGKTIALVPTMGALHEGHLTLMRQAKAQCDVVIISIFVNPTQFGPQEDFSCYPRNLAGDSQKASQVGVDAIFHPTVAEMYPNGYSSYVAVEGITDKLCGLSRPGHFRGVTTVVSKLFNIVQPDKAFFGQKDAQQILVINRMVRDLNMNVQLEMVPIVREDDGLAMSSRNRYLSAQERDAALVLSQSLLLAQRLVHEGERDIAKIRAAVVRLITEQPLAVNLNIV